MKYIKVEWPESQDIMDKTKEWYICIEDENSIFVPENIYNEIQGTRS